MAMQTPAEVEEVLSEINVTPLVDVMLVLLVVFIVTAPLLTQGIRVNLPQTNTNTPPDPNKALVVSVDAAGKIYLDKSEIELPGLTPRIQELRSGQPELTVQLNADRAINYGLVAKVMSAVDRAGVTKLSVLTSGE